MKNFIKVLLALMLIVACVCACASCQLINGGNNTPDNSGDGAQVEDGTDADDFEDTENSYRIRFVYSYTAKVENSSGRLENKQSIVTVKSFYIPKDNAVVSADLLEEMKNISYHGFNFVKWYSEWDTVEQKGIEGKEFAFDNQPITEDITLYCDRGNLAGENITWELVKLASESADSEAAATEDEKYVLKLNGSGKMFDFLGANEVDIPWYKNSDSIVAVEVSDGITSIGNNSFNGLSNLKQVDLPDSIERIGISSFERYGATSFTAPASLKVIEKNAFVDTSLREVVLNEGLLTLGERAFYGSNKIKTIVFPTTVKEIPVAAFHPGTVNNKNNKHYLSKVYYLGNPESFSAINIGIDNTWFADKATIYYYRESLADGEVGTYWRYADADSKVAVQYFYTLRYIQGSAKTFLCNIYVPVDPVRDSNGEIIRDEEGLPLLKGVITEDHIRQQNAITYHGYQFSGFSGADTLRVGNEITADLVYTCQRGNILSSDGGIKWAFTDSKLTIYVDTTTEARITADVEGRIKGDKLILTAAEKEILGVSDDEITVTDEIKAQIIAGRLERSLRMWDFEYSYDISSEWTGSTSSIIIEDGVKYIGRYAFAGIARTSDVVIPASVEAIHASAFEGCTDLIAVYYDGVATADMIGISNDRFTVYSKVESGTSEIGNYWMIIKKNGVSKRLAWTLDANGKLVIAGDSTMINFSSAEEAPWYGAKDAVKSVKFADHVTSLAEYAINGYTNVTSISISRNARNIPASALAGTGIVNNVDGYTNNLLVISGHLIKVNPVGLDINMVETYTGIVTIAQGAFEGISHINGLYVARTIQSIHREAFAGCTVDAIFADGDAEFWAVIDAGVDFPDSKIYFKHADEYITVVNKETGKQETVKTSTIADTYWFKNGDEYVIWGEK